MATDPTVDIEALLAPLAGEDPCGKDLSFEAVFDDIRAARVEEDKSATEGGGALKADWSLIVKRASEALASQSKDLMLAAFLTEALSEQRGFPGLRDGLRVINGLLERHWDGVHPRLGEDGDRGKRLGKVVWMLEPDKGSRLPNRVRSLPLFPSPDPEIRISHALFSSGYAGAKGGNEDEAVYQQRVAQATERERVFKQAQAVATLPQVTTIFEDLKACQEEANRFNQLLDQRFERDAPGTGALREAIEDCFTLVERAYKEKAPAELGSEGGGEEVTETGGGGVTPAGKVGSREEALRRLSEIATYFRSTEPHSPVSYLVDRAVAWGRLPLDQLLQELIKDSSARDQVGDLLGLKRGE